MDRSDTILVVDDEEPILEAIGEILHASGYEVILASCGREALLAVESALPDAILLDLLMPDINGYEVCRLLKEDLRTREIPVIILTGFGDPQTRDLAMGSGADEFLTKPFSKIEMLARVGAVLRTRHLVKHLSELRRESTHPVPPAQAGNRDGTLLLVEDEDELQRSIRGILEETGLEVLSAGSLAAGRDILRDKRPDVVLLDLLLPDGNGLDLLREIKADPRLSAASVIVLTAMAEVNAKVHGLEMGADDYLVKPVSAVELRARVRNQLHAKRERDAILARYTEVSSQALLDPLTGLFNRRHLDETLPKILEGARRHHHEMCVLMVDIDHFKQTNDTLGHGAGDEVLRWFADMLRQQSRAMDWVARYGGEEFVVVLPLTDIDTALLVAERLRAAVAAGKISLAGRDSPWSATVSIGVAGLGGEPMEPSELLLRADKALYLAKRMGRNQVQAYGA